MRARPPGDNVRAFPAFTVRVRPELRDKIVASATRNRRSLSAEVEVLLEEALRDA